MVGTDARVGVNVDTKKARASLNALSQAFYIAGSSASRFGTVARASFAGIAVGAAAFGATKMVQFLNQSVRTFIEFNDTLARTGAILGSTGSDLNKLEGTIRDIGKSTRFTAAEVGEAANKLAIAGVTADEMISDRALENLVKFAIAGGVDIQTATNIGIAGVKAFGMEMDQLGLVSDVLTRTFTRSNVDIVSLGEGLKFVAPVAFSAGISIQETASAVGALGNAGLRGTIAGTGLRMAINKLLKPTFDATRAMNDLGLNVKVLSPSGKAAESQFKSLTIELDRATRESMMLKTELKALNDTLTETSINQQRNNLAIAQIRQRASRQNRDLTEQELKTITRLEEANSALALSEQELNLERTIQQHKLSQVTAKEKEMKEESTELLRTIEQQTVGITSLGDVLDQLAASGATTTQILEVFGVRGGTAIASLVSQRESFHGLVEETQNATGATNEYTESLQRNVEDGGSALESLRLFMSRITEAMIEIGRPLTIMLTKLTDAFGDDIMNAISDLMPEIKKLGEEIAIGIAFALPLVLDALPDIIMLMRALVPVVMLVAVAFRILMALIQPFAQVLVGIFEVLKGIVEMAYQLIVKRDAGAAFKAIKDGAGSGLKNILSGGLQIGLGMATGGASRLATAGGRAGITGSMSGLAFGGGISARGALGAATTKRSLVGTGVSGFGLDQFHTGGIISQPSIVSAGERGPEAIIPLGNSSKDSMNRNKVMMESGLSGSGGGSVSIQNMNVSTDISKFELERMVKNAMVAVLNTSSRRGGSGF